MKVRILSLAESDLLAGYKFYERQSEGLGNHFPDTIYLEIESLHSYAGIHLLVSNFHRLLSRKFPYAIYYRIEKDDIQVWRVLDCRKNPVWVARQLR